MSIHKMSLKDYAEFCKANDAQLVTSFSTPKDVRVLATTKGAVVMVDYGHDGVTLIGDGVGIYWGEKAPDYLK